MWSVRIIAAAVVIGAGTFMTAQGLKAMQEGLSPFAIAPVMEKIRLGKPVDVQTLDAARQYLHSSADGTDIVLAGVIASERARAAGIRTQEGQQWLKLAAADLRSGLSRAPTDGLSWLRLASSEFLLNGPRPQITSAMRMGMYTARSNFKAVPILYSLSIVLWSDMDADLRQYTIKTVRDHWPVPGFRALMHKLAITDNGQTILRTAIKDDPALEPWIQSRVAFETRVQNSQAARRPR